MCSGSGVIVGISYRLTVCWVGMVEEVTFAVAGCLCLSRHLVCHSRMHLLHQIVQVTTLSTNVIAKNKSNSSIMIVSVVIFFHRDGKTGFHYLLCLCPRSGVWSDCPVHLGQIRVVVIICFWIACVFRERVRVPLLLSPPLFFGATFEVVLKFSFRSMRKTKFLGQTLYEWLSTFSLSWSLWRSNWILLFGFSARPNFQCQCLLLCRWSLQ